MNSPQAHPWSLGMVSIAKTTRWGTERESIDPSTNPWVPPCHASVAFSLLVLLVIMHRFHSVLLIWSLLGTSAYPRPSFSPFHLFSQYLIQFSFNKWLLFLKCRLLQPKIEASTLVCKTCNGCFHRPHVICTLLADPSFCHSELEGSYLRICD